MPDDDVAAEMYEASMTELRSAGYDQYEVSNWSRGAQSACRHNLLYWRNQEWIGVGPGAHSHLRFPVSLRGETEAGLSFLSVAAVPERDEAESLAVACRWANRKGVQGYIRRVETGENPVGFHEALPAEVSMGETMMLGLRLVQEGVSFSRFEEMHGRPLGDVFGPVLDRLQEGGLLESDSGTRAFDAPRAARWRPCLQRIHRMRPRLRRLNRLLVALLRQNFSVNFTATTMGE